MTRNSRILKKVFICALTDRMRITFPTHVALVLKPHPLQITFKRRGLTAQLTAHEGFGTTLGYPADYFRPPLKNVTPHWSKTSSSLHALEGGPKSVSRRFRTCPT